MTDDNRPVWQVPADVGPSDELPEACEDLVIGAGVVGLTTALLLARAGRRVCVVEARYVGAGSTGHSSAKISLLQGTRLSSLMKDHDRETVRSYVELNRAGYDWLTSFADEHGVRIDRRPAVTFAANPMQVSSARSEYVAAKAMGLPVEWTEDDLDLPFPTHGAVVLPHQAQVDPGSLLQALAEQFRENGGVLVEGARVEHVSKVGHPRATLTDGRAITAESIVVATGAPILDRSLAFSDLEPQRSYVVAYEMGNPPRVMALSAGSPSVSIRDAFTDDGRSVLLVGGFGHGVGRTSSEREHVEAIRTWATEHFAGVQETAVWSAQDYTTGNGLPRYGRMPRGGGRIWFATGFAKWGFTNGTAAAIAICEDILGSPVPWMRDVAEHSSPLVSVRGRALINAGVARETATGLARAVTTGHRALEPGQGAVHREGAHIVAESRTESGVCRVSGLCTHLGGVLRWNDVEQSWDCPLHGSRFSAEGEVLNGPATRSLARLDDEPNG
ncbi:FAD-dependent oxidoreductase [Aeromicrobium duanguangcaii]|uniref:FAD-dependent oxidoreductase n=1 Tax=Aeromicrobium duanguangcaii TaxID=2968086 RepID=UPI00201745AF|nr:FAD-dependent oxidoreductase [Aeromicrobium duanguangcaii]MCL3838954.1 FAD-dependent oxidoreductase [Aeromicrobium duanguangcaii]